MHIQKQQLSTCFRIISASSPRVLFIGNLILRLCEMLALIGSDIECFQRENCPFSWDMPATFNPCPPVFPLFSLWGLFVWSIRISLGNHRRNREKRHFRRLKSAANVTECDDSEIFEKFSDGTAYWLSSETGTIKKVKWRLIWVDFLPLFYVVALLFSFYFRSTFVIKLPYVSIYYDNHRNIAVS